MDTPVSNPAKPTEEHFNPAVEAAKVNQLAQRLLVDAYDYKNQNDGKIHADELALAKELSSIIGDPKKYRGTNAELNYSAIGFTGDPPESKSLGAWAFFDKDSSELIKEGKPYSFIEIVPVKSGQDAAVTIITGVHRLPSDYLSGYYSPCHRIDYEMGFRGRYLRGYGDFFKMRYPFEGFGARLNGSFRIEF